jgi:hypothetical protein
MTPKELAEKLRGMDAAIDPFKSSYDHAKWQLYATMHNNISTILAALEAYEAWVPKEERLPDYDQLVLWVGHDGGMFTEPIDKDDTEMTWLKYTTHWRTLPAPPEVEE